MEYTHKVRDMSCLFENCLSLNVLPDISKWDTSNLKEMRSMFNGCSSLKVLPDISKWNTKNVDNTNTNTNKDNEQKIKSNNLIHNPKQEKKDSKKDENYKYYIIYNHEKGKSVKIFVMNLFTIIEIN